MAPKAKRRPSPSPRPKPKARAASRVRGAAAASPSDGDITAAIAPLNEALQPGLAHGVLAAFREWDTDGSGDIAIAELSRVLTAVGVLADVVPALFSMADANKDSRIDYEEFVAWLFTVAPDAVPEGTEPPFYPFSGDDATRRSVNEILPGLYLTNFRGAADLAVLRLLEITSVLCIDGTADENPHPDVLRYMNIEGVTDDEDQAEALRAHFDAAARFIDKERKRGGVVVHCAAGISRSSTCVLYYLMKCQGMRLRDAFAHTWSRRRVIWPNKGFMARLIDCEAALGMKPPSIRLAEYERWTAYDAQAYGDARIVDRPGIDSLSGGPRDYGKLRRNVERFLRQHGEEVAQRTLQPVVLLSTGSLCPIHLGHVRNFELARKALENSKAGITVVGGFLSPTHDDYVVRKYGGYRRHGRVEGEAAARRRGWLDMHQRLDLVRLAVSESDWLEADGWEAAQDEFYDYPSVAETFSAELLRLFPVCKLFYVCGEDLLSGLDGSGLCTGVSICVVTRPGSGRLAEHVGKHGGNFVVRGGDENVSSTMVRECFRDGRADEARALLHPSVYDRLVAIDYAGQLSGSD